MTCIVIVRSLYRLCLYLHKGGQTDRHNSFLITLTYSDMRECRSYNFFVRLTDNNDSLDALSFCSLYMMNENIIDYLVE